jgi:hypothetical protein
LHLQSPAKPTIAASPAATPPVPANSPATAPAQSTLPTSDGANDPVLLEAKKECYPPEVCEYLAKNTKDLTKDLDPTGKMAVMMQASAVDRRGTLWLGLVVPAGPILKIASVMQDQGIKTLSLGNTDIASPAAIISDTGVMLPVVRTQIRPRGPGQYRMSVSLGQTPGVIDSVMSAENFCLITEEGNITAQNDGGYRVHLNNYPGISCIQQLVLVVSKDWRVRTTSQPPASTHPVGDFVIDVWQKRVNERQDFSVHLVMDRNPATPAQ